MSGHEGSRDDVVVVGGDISDTVPEDSRAEGSLEDVGDRSFVFVSETTEMVTPGYVLMHRSVRHVFPPLSGPSSPVDFLPTLWLSLVPTPHLLVLLRWKVERG